jgi:hypothetical protein
MCNGKFDTLTSIEPGNRSPKETASAAEACIDCEKGPEVPAPFALPCVNCG